jgi:nucleoid DNA-binding protein
MFDRPTALNNLKDWLIEHMPVASSTTDFRFVNRKKRTQMLVNRGTAIKQRTRVSVAWRDDIANRLKLNANDIVRATNTILEMMDKELSSGGRVRITGFGDLITIATQRAGRECRFRAAEEWMREINDPIFFKEIGLFYKKIGKARITRRTTPMQ